MLSIVNPFACPTRKCGLVHCKIGRHFAFVFLSAGTTALLTRGLALPGSERTKARRSFFEPDKISGVMVLFKADCTNKITKYCWVPASPSGHIIRQRLTHKWLHFLQNSDFTDVFSISEAPCGQTNPIRTRILFVRGSLKIHISRCPFSVCKSHLTTSLLVCLLKF